MVFSNNLLMGAAGQGGGYEIDQSIRFNDDDSAYLTRTPGSAGNQRTFTFSTWVKFCTIKADNILFSSWIASGASAYALIYIDSNFNLRFEDQNASQIVTTQVFRDTSAWYHVVVRVDTTDGTSGDRYQMYINGSRVTSFTTETQPALNYQTNVNKTQPHYLGRNGYSALLLYSDLYQAETHFIDGTALDASSFGETNDDGVWIPKAYSGAYGTNGFYITGATDSDLGEDFSGNGNDFTSSGLTTADQMLDTPTLNASTLNPLWAGAGLSDGNLVATATGNSYQRAISTFAIDDGGKYACEFQKSSGTFGLIGIMQLGNNTVTSGNSNMYGYNVGTGEVFKGNPTASVLIDLGAGAANSLMRVEYDSSADTIKIFDDGVEIFPAATGVSNTVGLTGQNSLHFGCAPYGSGTVITATFQGLSGTPTADFLELTSTNLDTPSIKDGSAHFQPTLYTGTSSALEVDQSGNSTFTPDLAWIKSRSGASNQVWIDSVRGVSKQLYSNADAAEATAADGLTSFDADGFTLGDDSGDYVNIAGANMVGWQWKANGSGSSNTDGSLSSTVSANQTAGFSIVTATPGTSGTDTIGHGLGIAPKMIIGKNTNFADNWHVYHSAISPATEVRLNSTSAATTTTWESASTSSVFQIKNGSWTNGSQVCLFYCFAEISGYSSIGSYEGNGSTDGTFVYTGFKPSFILTKNIDTADQWGIRDTARNPFNVTDKLLNPNASTAETSSSTGYIDILSNGFKPRSSDSNINTQTIIYMAFAENPFGGDGVAPATAR